MANARSTGVEPAPPRSTVGEKGGSTMRYRCVIIDEEKRLDAGLLELFAAFAASTPLERDHDAGEPGEADGRRTKRAPWRATPWPAPRMW
jgi:hypothetical protein